MKTPYAARRRPPELGPMFNYRRQLLSALFPALFFLSALTPGGGFVRSQDDREATRHQAEQPVLSAAQRKQLFESLRTLALDENASPDDRCMDVYRAINVLQRIDPARALAFGEEMEKAGWYSKAGPEARGMFRCGIAVAYLVNRQNRQAAEVLKSITAEERQSAPQVEANRGHDLLLASAATGNEADIVDALKSLVGCISNPRLSTRARSGYLIDVLRYLFDQGAPPAQIQSLIAKGEKLLPQTEGEPGDQLAVFLEVVKSQMDFGAPWPASKEEADARVLRLSQALERLRAKLEECKTKYGPSDPATVMAAQAISTMDLELVPYDDDEATLEREAFNLCDYLIKESTSIMVEPERVWFVKGVAAAMLGEFPAAEAAYGEVKKIHAAAAVDSQTGYRFSRRLLLLTLFGEKDPAFVADEFTSGVDAFANHVRSLALRDPELALSSLDAWNPLSTYGSIPRHGRAATFLEGYIQATGIVKNVPFRRKGTTPSDQGRLYGRVGLADVQANLSRRQPMLVYVRFQDAGSPYRSYYGGFFLDGKNVKFVDLGDCKPIDLAVAAWRKSMRAPVDGGAGDPAVTGKALYALLVRPLISGALPSNLYVVPDQGLEQVSFAALRTPVSRWVLQDCAVNYLGAIRDVTRHPAGPGAMRPSAFFQADAYQDHSQLGEASLSLKALKVADASAVSKAPTAEELLAVQSPYFLHLSVHGDNRPANQPLEFADASWLVLPGAKGATEDLTFTARQVATMRLEGTRCVLLAACGAAKGQVLSGEGIGGLRRAFYIAGARSVISSLLLVPETPASLAERRANRPGDAPGDELLSRIYGPLAKGFSPADALRMAQMQMLRNSSTASPRFWGGFICEGN